MTRITEPTFLARCRLFMWVERLPKVPSWAFAVFVAGLLLFSGMLLQKWWPSVAASVEFLFYAFGMLAILLVALLVAVVSGSLLLWSRLRGKPTFQAARVPFIASVVTIGSFILVVAIGSSFQGALPTGSDLRAFDHEEWCAPDASSAADLGFTPRQCMLGDVVESVLPGSTQADVERLLGPSYESSHFRSAKWDLIYPLGPQRDAFFGLDSEWLVIWFDDEGAFKRFEVWVD